MSDIVVDLRLMSEELLRAASVIENQRRMMQELKGIIDSSLGVKVEDRGPTVMVEPEVKKHEVKKPAARKENKTPRSPKKSPEEQLEELKVLMNKEDLTPVEKTRLNNLYFRLKKSGIEVPPKKDNRFKETRGRKKESLTMANKIAPDPDKDEVLYNCFKEVKPGYWERDGINLTYEQAEDTIHDLKMEGFKAVIREASKGYVYKEEDDADNS